MENNTASTKSQPMFLEDPQTVPEPHLTKALLSFFRCARFFTSAQISALVGSIRDDEEARAGFDRLTIENHRWLKKASMTVEEFMAGEEPISWPQAAQKFEEKSRKIIEGVKTRFAEIDAETDAKFEAIQSNPQAFGLAGRAA